jgi:hypothetical protein
MGHWKWGTWFFGTGSRAWVRGSPAPPFLFTLVLLWLALFVYDDWRTSPTAIGLPLLGLLVLYVLPFVESVTAYGARVRFVKDDDTVVDVSETPPAS